MRSLIETTSLDINLQLRQREELHSKKRLMTDISKSRRSINELQPKIKATISRIHNTITINTTRRMNTMTKVLITMNIEMKRSITTQANNSSLENSFISLNLSTKLLGQRRPFTDRILQQERNLKVSTRLSQLRKRKGLSQSKKEKKRN